VKRIFVPVAIITLLFAGCSMFKNKDTFRETKMYNVVEKPPLKKAPKK
jgi:hypothetical protein